MSLDAQWSFPAHLWERASIPDLEFALRSDEVSFWVHHNKLFFHDPSKVLSREMTDLLTRQQHDILRYLVLHPRSAAEKPRPTSHSQLRTAPLAFQQESALLYDEPSFYEVFAARVRGRLDVDSLYKSLITIVQRHSATRSRIVVADGALVQEIDETSNAGLAVEFSKNNAECESESLAREIIKEFVVRWLAEGRRTFEARLIRLKEDEHILVVAWDHLFEDFISARLAFSEMWIAYQGFTRQVGARLSKKPMQYYEYAQWQRSTYSQWLEANGDFWKKHLAGAQSLQLRKDGCGREARPIMESRFEIAFGITLSHGLHQLARSEQVIPGLVIFALCVSLFAAWSGQSEFILPFYALGRHSSRLIQVAGYLAHPLPLRVEVHETDTFFDLLHRISSEFMDASQRLSNGRSLIDAPNPFESPFIQWFDCCPHSCHAIVQSCRDWRPSDVGLSLEAYQADLPMPQEPTVMEHVPLLIGLWNSPQGIVGDGFYRQDHFSHETITKFLKELQSAAELVVFDRLALISTLSSRR